jgi:integration host factor subunit beta
LIVDRADITQTFRRLLFSPIRQARYNPEAQSAPRPSQENEYMTKKEMARDIAEQTGLPQLQMLEVVRKTLDAVVATLITERRIELRGFGVFEVKKRSARKARNPRTGETVLVPERLVVTFSPGKEMNDRIGAPAETSVPLGLTNQRQKDAMLRNDHRPR